jgi:diaminopimelate epimerase
VFFLQQSALETVPLEKLGPKVENHNLFPEKTNVEIAHVENKSRIRMRVWERGVGITRACGTGACAVAIAGVRRGLTSRKATVVLDGGELDIEWRESDNHVLMTGAVAEVYRGELA